MTIGVGPVTWTPFTPVFLLQASTPDRPFLVRLRLHTTHARLCVSGGTPTFSGCPEAGIENGSANVCVDTRAPLDDTRSTNTRTKGHE